MEVPQKIKNRTTILSSNSISGNISKRNKNTMLDWYQHTLIFITVLFTIVKTLKQPKCPSKGEWIENLRCICMYLYIYIYICIHILFSHKKENLAICDMMDCSIMQSQRKTNTLWSHLYVKSWERGREGGWRGTMLVKNKESRLVVSRGGGWGNGNWMKVVKRYKLMDKSVLGM